ncbi:cytochrome P450 [Xylariomycetidae sp. FL2044]|nr:cytochrome P450 [Xylariomycetidae sp. FL2044]
MVVLRNYAFHTRIGPRFPRGHLTNILLATLSYFTQHKGEPPALETAVPFFSPMSGSLPGMQKFVLKLRSDASFASTRQTQVSIYALRMPGQRIYVVNSLALTKLLQRQIKTIAFAPIEAESGDVVMGPALPPGPGPEDISGTAVRCLSESVARLREGDSGPTTGDLYRWIRGSPFRDPVLEQAWYDFEPSVMKHIMKHMLEAWPSLLPVFEQYFAQDGHLQRVTLLVQCRSAFWMGYHMFSDPVVLRKFDGSGMRTIYLAELKTACPNLLSTWQETLRYAHIGISARVVMQDVRLDSKYFLKQDATVMTIAPVQHTDTTLWGATANQLDHCRFLRTSGAKRANPAAFRAFGGGTVFCPGRHFASSEIMSFAALRLLRFYVKPVDRRGVMLRRWRFSRGIERNGMDSFPGSSKGVDMVVEDVTRAGGH